MSYDLRGIAIRQGDRVAYCRCGDTGLTLAWVALLDPLIVFEPDAKRYTRIVDSRHVVVVDDSEREREVRRALRGIGAGVKD